MESEITLCFSHSVLFPVMVEKVKTTNQKKKKKGGKRVLLLRG